jgi:hypothetical protein
MRKTGEKEMVLHLVLLSSYIFSLCFHVFWFINFMLITIGMRFYTVLISALRGYLVPLILLTQIPHFFI